MLSTRIFGLACAVTVFVCLMAAPVSAQPLDKRTLFTFSGPVALPGVTLAAGQYLFRLADPNSSSKVVQVLNADGTKPYGLFFTIAAERLEPASSPEVRFMETASGMPISNGLSYIGKGHHPRRVLVVVGDGGDNASTKTFDHVLKEAQTSNAAIYTVGIIDPLERDANPGLLRRLADATGGASFFPRGVDDVDDVLQQVADDIRHSYTLGYISTNSARDGKFRRIRVVVNDPDRRSLRVRARDGYRAGEPLPGR
jgi:hypothetical protein